MTVGHGWVGGKFYASLADVPCSGRDAEWVRCPKSAANWDGWCADHAAPQPTPERAWEIATMPPRPVAVSVEGGLW